MAPVPQEHFYPNVKSPSNDGERVVISGMSGLYPQSRSVKELSEILYTKINPIRKEKIRYDFEHSEVNQYSGNIPDVDLFDAQFFGVHFRLAGSMDSMSRKILEHSYQAIYDAGVNPTYLSGKKVGVYVGSCFSASEKSFYYDKSGFGMAGCSKAMFANRVSYWLNAKGPSMSIDESCCSSSEALHQAYKAMNRGDCEAAVVAGSFLCLHPQYCVHYSRTLRMCPDGKTKAFAENADGCAKSEAISVMFLQKAKDAIRIYADVLNVKCEYVGLLNEETGPKYGFYREPRATIEFLKKFYDEVDVPPQAIEYIEAFGSAIPEIDKIELENIDNFFCNERDHALLVGSVMSNIGYNEAATGLTAVTKVLLGYHTGVLAPNLHCERPRQDVACLREGRVRIVTDPKPWRRGYVAVNGLSMTGINSHVLLHGHYKPKDLSRYKSNIPYLVPISARQEEGVKNVVENLKSRPIDPEELALFHNIHQYNTSGHLGRGYVILDTDASHRTVSLGEKSAYFDDVRRPLWFVYSGMGSQWATMGTHLMRIPVFAAAIQRCHEVLQPKGINIVDIITLPDNKMFDNILHSFIGIASIQIGLTDVLKAIGLIPDGIIGHSVGELGCAYADGCFTAEEMILSAYSRGLVSLHTPFIRGSMAAVGIGYSQIKHMCPPEIEVACHNGPESCTISGPAEAMKIFIAELTSKGIFAKEVPCSNIAFHSRYISSGGPALLKYLKEVIPNPRPRSDRWISSSVPQDKWDEPLAKYSSAEYHTNNLLSPVLFEEASKLIPSNAVLVEVAPHGLLQAILKRSISPDCLNIPITKRNHPDNVVMLLDAIGTLFTNGYSVKVQNLYPKVEFPVSTGTPLLSHLVEWAHGEYWPIPAYKGVDWVPSACCKFVVSIFDTEHMYIRGNKIRGQTLYPFAAVLVSVWDTLAMVMGVPKKQLSVRFRDVYLYTQPIIHERRQLSFYVVIHRGSGSFEVLEDTNAKVATGFITPVNTRTFKLSKDIEFDGACDRAIQSDDLYKWFEDRGYSYSDKFRSIVNASSNLDRAELSSDNWVTLIDGMLQLSALRQPHSSVSVPTSIKSIGIDVEEENRLKSLAQKFVNVEYLEKYEVMRGGGVHMEAVLLANLPNILLHDVLIQSISNSNDNQRETGPKFGNATLISRAVGDYNYLQWVEASVPSTSTANGLNVKVDYAGITNSDFKKASGAIPLKSEFDNGYGMDFSGVLKSGERVMGILPSGACSQQIQVIPELLWPVPPHWNSEDAATVPSPYLHAFYLLMFKGRLQPNMNVLVHGGAGALGQAAIAVALAHNCTVFTTVSDMRKKRLLLKLFPKLKEEYIANSREDSFKDTVLTATKGRGCEIILSSVKSGLKQNNFECCAFTGIVIDANQLQEHENFNYGMAAMFKQRSYCISDFSDFIISNNNRKELKVLHLMLSEGIALGYVRPLTRVTFAAHQAPRAFRLLASSAHRGRVLLDLRSANHDLSVKCRITCNAESSHLIINGEGSLGLHLAKRLVLRGARRIHLNIKPEMAHLVHPKIQSWKDQGLDIVVTTTVLDSVDKINAILNAAALQGPVEGVYLLNVNKNEIVSDFDKISRKICQSLKYFAVINTVDEVGQNICAERHQRLLPATMLILPKPDDDIWASQNEWCNFAVEAIERALINPGVALRAQPMETPKKTLLEEVAQISGITIDESLIKETTLTDLGFDEDTLNLISNLLKNKYNLHFDDLSQFTIEKLIALENVVRQSEFKKLEGLAQFINNLESDELVATSDLVPMTTLISGELVAGFDFDSTKMNLIIVPGVEGHHKRFRLLCERLKIGALVLQPRLDSANQTLQEVAEKYAQVLLKKAGLKGQFYLMGYESGTAVALEVAGILEDYGLDGTIFCLGCAADDFKETLKDELKKYKSEDDLQDAVLYHIFSMMACQETAELVRALKNTSTWKEKIELCVSMLLGRVPYTTQYIRELIEATFARIVQVQNYRVTERKLRSKIVYLRAAGYSDSKLGTLQRYSQQPLVVHQLSATLPHAAFDLRCAAIINNCLPRELLDEYDHGNTCESYEVEGEKFTIRSVEE